MAVQLLCRRTIGNKTVSLIDSPVNAINNRSIPIPVPVVGGIAYSNAARKSSSSTIASSSPAAAARACACEPFPLDHGVDQFGVSGGQLEAAGRRDPTSR